MSPSPDDCRVLAGMLRAGWQPRRVERYRTRDDPDLDTRTADGIGLSLDPPRNAVVFSVDLESHMQALHRLYRVLLLSIGSAERHG